MFDISVSVSNLLPSYYLQASGGQLLGRPAPSPGTTGTPNFENVSTPPMPYANSPRSGTNMMNTPSPQQHLTPQQQRQKLMQHSQPLHQPVRPSAAGMLAQVKLGLHLGLWMCFSFIDFL
jgi:hypothetical protein